MRYVGLDVHYGTSTNCVLEENGQEVQCETVRGHWPKLLDRLRTVEGPWTICFEATCGYGYLYRELSRMATRVAVAHPGQVRLIFRAKRKNDRIDARKLAKLLYLDEVPEAYVPGQEVQSWRELIEHRRHMVDRQAAWQGVYRSPTIRAYFERVLHGRPERRKIALVATAHYLLRCMHAILVSGKPWHEAA
jgi:hypothetical protein